MSDPLVLAALAAAGFVSGVLNVLAGGGSFLTLPILIFMGLPPTIANGTNRVGILAQSMGAVWGFHRHGLIDWRWAAWAGVPAAAGAALGTWAAIEIGDEAFRRALAFLMVGITLVTLLGPTPEPKAEPDRPPRRLPLAIGFLAVGLYGGFVQAGVGFLILAVTTWAGVDLVRGNAVKVLSVLIFTGLSLAIFAWHGRVDWRIGLVLAAANTAGAEIGVRLSLLKGHRWLHALVTVTVIAFAVVLWFE